MAVTREVFQTRLRGVFAVAVLSLPVAGAVFMAPCAAAQSANMLSPAVGKNLQAASTALSRKNFVKAMSSVAAADAIKVKTEYETYTINQMRAAVASASGDHQAASSAYKALIASSRSSAAEKHQMMMALATSAYTAKDYGQAVQYIRQYIKAAGPSTQMQTLLAQAYYLQNDFGNAAEVQSALIDADVKAGRKPTENALQFLATCYAQTHSASDETHAYVLLAKYYSKPEYWARLVHDLATQQKMPVPLRFNLMRLLAVTGTLKAPGQWVDMAERAVQAGLPQLGLNLLNEGFANGVLDHSADMARLQRLKALMVNRANATRAQLTQSQAAAQVDATGQTGLTVGYNLILNAQVDAGLEQMREGLAVMPQDKKALGELEYAMALRDAGRTSEAIKAFENVDGDPTARNLAQLWEILSVGRNGKGRSK